MRLPFFSSNGIGNSKHYLGLFLKEEEGIAFVLYESGGKIMIQEKEHFHYSNGWEHIIEDVDEVLFRFEQKLKISLDQTIFFVYSHFIDKKIGDIRKPYIQKIKEIVKNLELQALGYIECSEAVLHYLEKKEEMPLTAILVELDKTNVGVFVYKGGRISYEKILSRTDNLIDDLLNAFEVLKGKFLLPARLILYNSKDLDDESAKILSYHWSDEYFIQLPRVEILREDETTEALMQVFHDQIIKEGGKVEEVLGFVIGEDVKEEEQNQSMQPTGKSPFKDMIRLPHLTIPSFNISRKLSIIGGIIVIVVSLVFNEIFLHKATLTVFFPSDPISKSIDIDTSVNESIDQPLPVLVSTSSATFSDSKAASGKRDIGEKAKGPVTIQSFDDNEKTFAKGTVLATSGLQFILNEDVKVASASLAADGSAKLPGKANGTITASDIGQESNVGKGARFSIDNLSQTTYFGINTDALTGGTRKQVQTVSKKDTEDLQASIMNKVKNPSASNKINTVRKEEEVISQLSKIELRDLIFSKEVGEETDSVKLSATADTVYFYFKKNTLIRYIKMQLTPDVKTGFTLQDDKIHYTIDKALKKNDEIQLHLSVNAKAIKQVPKEELIRNSIGRSKSSIENLLKKQYQAQGFELSIKDPLPFFNSILPFLKNNITVVISSL